MPEQCIFSSTLMSLYFKANSFFDAIKYRFVNPGCFKSCPNEAIKQEMLS